MGDYQYLSPEELAAEALFNDKDFRTQWPDDTHLMLNGERVSFNQVVKRFRESNVPAMYAGIPIDPGPAGFHNWPEPEQVDLTRFRLVYLGSPYTKYAAGIEQAFRDVSAIAAEMLREGVRVYSPIAHTHPIATYGNLDPLNHEIWLPFDQAMMDAAEAMVVADMDDWRESYGVRYEIDYFRAADKPVYFRSADGSVDILR